LNVNIGKSRKILATLGIYGAYNIKAVTGPEFYLQNLLLILIRYSKLS
jgi:hypothetical protein